MYTYVFLQYILCFYVCKIKLHKLCKANLKVLNWSK